MLKIGTDITPVARITRLREKYNAKFLHKILRKSEMEIFRRDESIAGVYAAKEALSKALGVGIGAEFGFHDAKVCKNALGAPYFKFRKRLKNKFCIKSSSLSITHDNGIAIAIVAIKLKKR